jgi:hypothetical protein
MLYYFGNKKYICIRENAIEIGKLLYDVTDESSKILLIIAEIINNNENIE